MNPRVVYQRVLRRYAFAANRASISFLSTIPCRVLFLLVYGCGRGDDDVVFVKCGLDPSAHFFFLCSISSVCFIYIYIYIFCLPCESF